jgi:cysteinyl-tRNA synthetase
MFKNFNEVLWIFDFWILENIEEIPEEIISKLDQRNKAKDEKNFELADKIRDEFTSLGYKIIDSREGSIVEKI